MCIYESDILTIENAPLFYGETIPTTQHLSNTLKFAKPSYLRIKSIKACDN